MTLSCVDSALFQSRHGFLASLNSNSLDETSFWMTVEQFDKEEEQEATLTEVIVRDCTALAPGSGELRS